MPLLEEMSQELGLPHGLIQGIARKADHAYKEYQIPKRSGGNRTIAHPSRPLKALQRWLLHRIVNAWPVHERARAYREGMSIRDNAGQHVANDFLLRMDIRDFFPSISAADVRLFLSEGDLQGTHEWNRDDDELFVRIVCRGGRLTIGAPTSPALSNALCYGLDVQLATLASVAGVEYTRYADDLFFSTNRRDVLGELEARVTDIVRRVPMPSGLRINDAKTWHASKRGRRIVTGLILASDGRLSVGRTRKRFIRRQIFRYEDLTPVEKRELAGLLGFVRSIEPDFISALILKYGGARVRSAQHGSQA